MNINRLNTTDVTRAPSNEGARVINLLSKSGAEGQSRTDTESPPPVFEYGASRKLYSCNSENSLGEAASFISHTFFTTGGEPLQ